MAVTPARTRELLYFAQLRNGLPYAYGGAFSKDSHVSTDCSGLVFSAAALLVGLSPYQRYGSTETLRLARLNRVAAPCGLIPANSAADVPRDSALKVGVYHGGGGPDSHTACTFITDGVSHNFESRGEPGVLLDRSARAWNDSLFFDFWYLPKAGGPDNPDFFPLPSGYYYGPKEGPDESISGDNGEPQVWIDRFKRWQEKAGDIPDGKYRPSTATVAKKIQMKAGIPATGLVDQKTWELVMGAVPMPGPVTLESIDAKLNWIIDQMGRGYPEWEAEASLGVNSKGERRTQREALSAILKK